MLRLSDSPPPQRGGEANTETPNRPSQEPNKSRSQTHRERQAHDLWRVATAQTLRSSNRSDSSA
eukprot:1288036-Heterocapsa_arctica.AAC.1